jgi:hypothetical protein
VNVFREYSKAFNAHFFGERIENVMGIEKSETSVVLRARKLPRKHKRVIVVCQSFRCLGYLDEHGVWRGYHKNDVLTDVIGWMTL